MNVHTHSDSFLGTPSGVLLMVVLEPRFFFENRDPKLHWVV